MAGSLVRTRSSLAPASSVPSATQTWPAWMDRPMPTPPPWWMDTQDAPEAVLTSAFSSGQSAMASEPSAIASASRYGEATEPQSRPLEVAGDAVQFGEDDADALRARRRFHVEHFLHGQAVAQSVGDGRDVVHAVHVGIELRVGAVLGNLLHAAMEIADDAFGSQDLLAIQFENYAQPPVRGGVLRAHVEN